MKHLLSLLLFLCVAMAAMAQGSLDGARPVRDVQDSLFQHLDKTRLVTGVLYDRVYHWVDATHFSTADTVTLGRAKQLWHEFYRATYNTEGKLSAQDASEKVRAARVARSEVVSVGYVNYRFETIDSNAVAGGRLIIRSDSLPDDGASGSPYGLHRLTIPVVFSERVRDSVLTFHFDSTLGLSNMATADRVVSITLRNAAGTSITLQPGGEASLRVVTAGVGVEVLVWADVMTASGLVFGYRTSLGLWSAKTTAVPDGKGVCVGDLDEPVSTSATATLPALTFQGYDETTPTEGSGRIKRYYRLTDMTGTGCDLRIRKPIIILDGFDPRNEQRKTSDDIYDLLYYNDSANHLGAELRLPPYNFDIIILNFPDYYPPGSTTLRDGGADYMERNGLVLVRLIQNINQELLDNGSSEKIVVVGPSMGGQVSRYALKYMENNGLNHNCRLWMAFDSPLLGANIPLGLQSFLWYAGYIVDNEDAKTKYDEQLRSIAAQQLLIHQTGDMYTSSTGKLRIPLHEPKRDTWQSMIDGLGYPSNLRRVALIDGTTSGLSNTPGGIMLDYKVKKAHFPGKGTILSRLTARFLPDYGGSTEVFDGYLRLGSDYEINLPQTVSSGPISSIRGALDGVPGGTYNTNFLVKKELRVGDYWLIGMPWYTFPLFTAGTPFVEINGTGEIDGYGGDNHCFIPSVSSLGFINSNFNWASDIGNRNLVCTGEIPFNNYHTETRNQEHVFISNDGARWAKEEIMRGGFAPCPTICSRALLGPSAVCSLGTATFTLDAPVPAGCTTTWTVPPSLLKISETANAITVKGMAGSMAARITANVFNPCGANTIVEREVIVSDDGPGYPTISKASTADCYKWNVTVTFPGAPAGVTTYNWSVGHIVTVMPSASTSYSSSGAGSKTYLLTNGDKISWSRGFTNACGTYDASRMYKLVVDDCSPYTAHLEDMGELARVHYEDSTATASTDFPSGIVVYPNPAKEGWQVSITDKEVHSLTIELCDLTGRVLIRQHYPSGVPVNIRVPATTIPAGNYLLKTTTNLQTRAFKVIKEE